MSRECRICHSPLFSVNTGWKAYSGMPDRACMLAALLLSMDGAVGGMYVPLGSVSASACLMAAGWAVSPGAGWGWGEGGVPQQRQGSTADDVQ